MSNNMVAAHSESNNFQLPKVPVNKEDWSLFYKRKIETRANTLQITEYLEGTATKPVVPPNTAKSFEKKEYREQSKEYKLYCAKAWQFIYDISDGTHLDSIVRPFDDTKDAVKAWAAIKNHYEVDLGGTTREILEEKLNNLSLKSSIVDLKLGFFDLVNEIEQLSTTLASLPADQRLVLDDNAKKIKLENAMSRNSSGRFATILVKDSLNVQDYKLFKDAAEKAIKYQDKVESMKTSTRASSKNAKASSENISIPALNVRIDENVLETATEEDLKAMKVELHKNSRRINRAHKRLLGDNQNTNNSSSHGNQQRGNNFHEDKRARQDPNLERPRNWRGGRRRNDPNRGGRYFNGRGNQGGRGRGRNQAEDASINNTNSGSTDQYQYPQAAGSYYEQNNAANYYTNQPYYRGGGRGRGYGRGRGDSRSHGRGGRFGRGGGRYQNQSYYGPGNNSQYYSGQNPYHAHQATFAPQANLPSAPPLPPSGPSPVIPFANPSPFPAPNVAPYNPYYNNGGGRPYHG